MERSYSTNVPAEEGLKVHVAGWARELRSMSTLRFIILADREGTIQITAKDGAVPKEVFDLIPKIERESVIDVHGRVRVEKQARGGREIIPERIEILSHSKEPLPLIVREQENPEEKTRFDARFMDLRRDKAQSIFRVRYEICRAIREYLHSQKFIEIQTPKITITGTESGAEVFETKYYGKPAYLVQSAQLYKQMAQAAGFDRVFEITPQWRAEKSNTARHLAESWSVDMEMSFIQSEEDVMQILEGMVVHAMKHVKDECAKHLERLKVSYEIPKLPLRRLTFKECHDFAKKHGIETEENDISINVLKEMTKSNSRELYFVCKWPTRGKPFYIMPYSDNPEWSRSFDLQFGPLEISSGGQRINDPELLAKRIKEKDMKTETLQFYLDSFKYGMPPHGGFGFGVDRFTASLLGIENVREAVLFPRTPDRIVP